MTFKEYQVYQLLKENMSQEIQDTPYEILIKLLYRRWHSPIHVKSEELIKAAEKYKKKLSKKAYKYIKDNGGFLYKGGGFKTKKEKEECMKNGYKISKISSFSVDISNGFRAWSS